MKIKADLIHNSMLEQDEYEAMYKILEIAFTQLNSRWQGDACNELIKKINQIYLGKTTYEEKYFNTIITLFVAYKETYSSVTWSSFPAQLTFYLNQFASKILEPQSLKQTTPYEQYTYNRMARVIQILSGIMHNDIFWKKYNNPQGVKYCATLLNTGYSNFEKWFQVTKHITSLANVNTSDTKGLFYKDGRDDKTQELYTVIYKQFILQTDFKLSFTSQAWDDPERTQSAKKNIPYKEITLPILRLEKIEDFASVPLKLRDSICTHLEVKDWELENFAIQIIENDEQYDGHFIDRIDSIQSGVQLLLTTLPQEHVYKFQAKKLNLYLLEVAEDCKNKLYNTENKPFEFYQHSLINYLQYTINTLVAVTGYSEENVLHYLSRAEEFALLTKKKPALCTIIKMFDSQDEYCVLIDKAISPIRPQLYDEFRTTIKFWPDIKYSEDLVVQSANGDMLNFKKGCAINYPKWFLEGYDDYEKVLQAGVLRQLELESKLDENCPINAVSSKLRILPAPANFQLHRLITLIKKENCSASAILTEHRPVIRASHIGSRDIKNNLELRNYHAENNLEQLMDEAKKWIIIPQNSLGLESFSVPVLFQTLISPLKISSLLGAPDVDLHEDKKNAVEKFKSKIVELNGIEIISTNHSFNYGKHLSYTNTNSPITYPAILKLIKLARIYNLHKQDDLLAAMIDELENLTKTDPSFISFSEYRELDLSAREQLVNDFCGGISIGGCVSAKDRKAVQLIYLNAMHIYYEKYGFIFKWDDTSENSLKFAKIVAALYGCKHMHINAGQNSPGANGLKDSGYFPLFLVKAIKEWHLEKAKRNEHYKKYFQWAINPITQSDQFASNNELDVILSTKKYYFHECSWMAPSRYHLDFLSSSPLHWNKILDSACMWLKSNPKLSELEIAYEELLTSPQASLDQKIITLYLLFNSEIKELNDFKVNACRSMGFITVLEAKIICNHLVKEKGYLKIIGSCMKKLEPNFSNCTIEGIENIKFEFSKLFPVKENLFHHCVLTKESLMSIRIYNQSGKALGIGLPRGYAYANLLETLNGVGQKIIILASLMKANKANRWFNGFGASQSEDKPLNIQQYVCTGLNLKDLNGVKDSIKQELKPYKHLISCTQIDEIAAILDNYPTLEQIRKIKNDLNNLFPSPANARTEYLVADLSQLIKQGFNLLQKGNLLELDKENNVYLIDKWTIDAFKELDNWSIPSFLAYALVLIQELNNRHLIPSTEEMLMELKALYHAKGTCEYTSICILFDTLILLQDKSSFLMELGWLVEFKELNSDEYKAINGLISWKTLQDFYWPCDLSMDENHEPNQYNYY